MKDSLKTIKKTLFTICIISFATLLISCENETFTSVDQSNKIETGINVKTLTKSIDGEILPIITNLMAGQHHIAGTVSVSSDGINLTVTYKTTCSSDDSGGSDDFFKSQDNSSSWTLKATHLFVGNCEDMPTTKKGNPKIGKFPYKTEHPDGVNEYTYTIPLSDIGECFCLAAHAEVDCGECNDDDGDMGDGGPKSSDDGDDYCGEETAWASGDEFPGNSWAMYNEFCIDDDNGPN